MITIFFDDKAKLVYIKLSIWWKKHKCEKYYHRKFLDGNDREDMYVFILKMLNFYVSLTFCQIFCFLHFQIQRLQQWSEFGKLWLQKSIHLKKKQSI